jgi:hypothetical protein
MERRNQIAYRALRAHSRRGRPDPSTETSVSRQGSSRASESCGSLGTQSVHKEPRGARSLRSKDPVVRKSPYRRQRNHAMSWRGSEAVAWFHCRARADKGTTRCVGGPAHLLGEALSPRRLLELVRSGGDWHSSAGMFGDMQSGDCPPEAGTRFSPTEGRGVNSGGGVPIPSPFAALSPAARRAKPKAAD